MPRDPAATTPDVSFGEAVGPVRPLRTAPARIARRVRPAPPPVPARPYAPPPRWGTGTPPDADAYAPWRRHGVQVRVLRTLRGARFAAQAECDLHGCTAEQAGARLAAFLAHAAGRGLQRVRVIHGRGRGVLRNVCLAHLRADDAVLAYAGAGPSDGGAGAVRVLLRSVPEG